jgi:hypothetical protein
MDFRDKDSQPLIKWRTPEEAFEAWKACSRGRPCDYTGLSYEKLSKGSGIQWPCNDEHPEGEPRPYKSLLFPTDADYCETFGHDLMTGGVVSPEKYRANNPSGRAILKPASMPGQLEHSIEEFVEYYNNCRYHESLDNLMPATSTSGRGQAILDRREKIKRKTIEQRRRLHQQAIAA